MEAMPVSKEALAIYRATAQRRAEARQRALEARRQRAWEAARTAAQLLKASFHASRVVVFGSLLREHGFHERSDIDLAAWGLAPEDYFLAVARLQEIDPEFEIDLVDVAHCQPRLRAVIEQEGVTL